LTKDQRTIFVSQLTNKVNESILKDFFGVIGEVNNVIMLRDKNTGRHKGFAYVEMKDLECISNCLLFNNVVPDFQKYPILVKASEAEKNFLAQREKAVLKDANQPDSRVYIGNLHQTIGEADILQILSQFGPVEYVNLHKDELGNSKGYAFSRFTRYEDAKMAMDKLTGMDIGGKLLKVAPVNDPRNNPAAAAVSAPTVADDVSQAFPSTSSWKLDDDEGGGMVLTSQSRASLMAKLGQNAGMNVPVPVVPVMSMPPTAGPPIISGMPSRCFVINNMFDLEQEKQAGPDWDLDIKEDVSEECSKSGKVEHCFVENRKAGGQVYVKMSTVEGAMSAAVLLNGRFFAGRMITVSYLDIATYTSMV
jgi:RNA-binding protein 23/39